jgi:hypothetical protein
LQHPNNMTKNILFILLFSLFTSTSSACDVCGCGPAGQFFGMLPVLEGRYASLRSQQQLFRHPSTAENLLNGEALTHDHLQSLELWMRWQLDDRWQLIMQLPYRHHARYSSAGLASNISGMGDVQLTAFYKILKPKPDKKWGHALSAGMQVVAPTGAYQQRDDQRRLLPEAFQIGTGAWGAQMQAFYSLSRNLSGLQLEGRVRQHLPNELDYQMGTAMGSSLQFFTNKQGKRFRWMYYGGLTFDYLAADKNYGAAKLSTGGKTLGLSAGIDLYTSKSAFHLLALLPTYQELYAAQPVGVFRAMLGYSRTF